RLALGPVQFLAGVRINQADNLAVHGGVGEEAAVRRETTLPPPLDIDLGSSQFLACGSVPARQGASGQVRWPAVGLRQNLAIGGEGEVLGPEGVFHRGEALSASDVPDPAGTAPNGEPLAVGAKGKFVDGGVLLLELAEFLAGVHLPDASAWEV